MKEYRFKDSGIVLVNKPKGISSNKVVNIVKFKLGAKKCGHLGTLDLEGEGLLPVTINNATKLFDFYLQKDKTYETEFVFGFETDTLDTSGKIVKECEVNFSDNELKMAVNSMIGKYMQMPPQYSAKKVNGQVGYKLARVGETINLSPKEVEIYEFKILKKINNRTFRFEITCSSGTYIRSVCRDLAYKLGTYGSMQCILRTRCGVFCIKDAYLLEDIEKGNFEIIPCQNLFDYDIINLSENDFFKLKNGQQLIIDFKDAFYKIYFNNQFLGVGEVREKNLKMKIRLADF